MLINTVLPTPDANDGVLTRNPERVGNRRWGTKVFLSGTEQPIEVIIPGSQFDLTLLSSQGRVFYASDADQNDVVIGQTSFANTTPTFLLSVPANTTAIPMMMSLSQTGTVAGADIDVLMEFDDVDRWASGGTTETKLASRTDNPLGGGLCTLRTGATASSGYGLRVAGWHVAADVSPAEGVINEIFWTPTGALDFLVGPASWAIYTYAGTTGPTWLWTFKWAELPTSEL